MGERLEPLDSNERSEWPTDASGAKKKEAPSFASPARRERIYIRLRRAGLWRDKANKKYCSILMLLFF